MKRVLKAFYMTGTGNSYKVADWSRQVAQSYGLEANLEQVTVGQSLHKGKADMYVFAYPTHGFTAPWLMLQFVWSLPRGTNKPALVLPTRAGTRVCGSCLPGMEGTAGYLIALILLLKGYRVQCVAGVDMPSNWTAFHWGMNEENVKVIVSKAEVKVKEIVQKVLQGKHWYSGMIPLAIGIGLVPISFMYLILAQLVLAKLFFAAENCNGCSLCKMICPKQAIIMKGETEKRPFWTYACDSCMACMNYCPTKSIEVSPVIILLFYYIMAVPSVFYVLTFLAKGAENFILQHGILSFLLQYMNSVISVAIAYRLLYYLLENRGIRRLLGRLSHTRYFRRYHVPEVALSQVHKSIGLHKGVTGEEKT